MKSLQLSSTLYEDDFISLFTSDLIWEIHSVLLAVAQFYSYFWSYENSLDSVFPEKKVTNNLNHGWSKLTTTLGTTYKTATFQ